MDNKKENIINRNITLIPVVSENKYCIDKIMNYTKDNYPKKFESLNKKIKDEKDENKRLQYQNTLDELMKNYENAINTNVPNNNMAKDYYIHLVKEAMSSEAQRKNYINSVIFSEFIRLNEKNLSEKEKKEYIDELFNSAFRKSGSKKGSLFDEVEINNPLNGYGNAFGKSFKSKFYDRVKQGLLYGKVSLDNYTLDSPFTISAQMMGFVHGYDSYEDLCEHINDNNCKIYFNLGANNKDTIARFRIDTGRGKKKNQNLLNALLKLYSGEYKPCGSEIDINKKGKICLHLSLSIPTNEQILDENTVVGVDMGIATPAYCALNNNYNPRLAISDYSEFLRIITQYKEYGRRTTRSLKTCSGGHGRKKKLRASNRLSKRRRNFAHNMNHHISKEIIKFALKHNAKYINLEKLKFDKKKKDSNKLIADWSYYELKTMIEYKAKKEGIEVRYIDPSYTSQTCSCCGSLIDGQRDGSSFTCKNPECKLYNKTINADYNAARNIAMSTKFIKNKDDDEEELIVDELIMIETQENNLAA